MSKNCKATLKFCYGTMNSGKSMFLLATAYNFEERHIPFICLKSSIDTRDGEDVIHSRPLGDRKCITITPETEIFNQISIYANSAEGSNLQFILVDEAQFLTETQVDDLSEVVDYLGINVICYGLRTDFRTKFFPGSQRLFEIADKLEEIESTCSCGNKNLVNARVDASGNIVIEGDQVMVGGEDKYITICRNCFKERLAKHIEESKYDIID